MNEWQPIKTAPKTGQDVLLFLGHPGGTVHEGRYMMKGRDPIEPEGWYWAGFGGNLRTIHGHPFGGVGPIYPTHWMPLPEEPAFDPSDDCEHIDEKRA
jgi:hypothetical protein